MAEYDNSQKFRVLVLGGCGFLGRNFVEFVVTNDLVSKIRVVDKVPPQTAWLNKHHQAIFDNPVVEFKSANLINPVSCQNAVNDPEGTYDYVVNFAAETKRGQTDPVYREGIVKLSLNCIKEVCKHNIKRYIEISSGQMYTSDKTPAKESSRLEPWTTMAKYKLEVEEELSSLRNLDYVILRPAIVYGKADKYNLMPRLVVGAVYKYLGEMMKLLWTKNLKMNTVHVSDMSRAVWHVCIHGKKGEIYNVVDKGETTQGKINCIISDIFNINHDYFGSALSSLAKIDINNLVEEINDKHMGPWAEICAKDGIVNTPLNPYLHPELLHDKPINLDGSKLEEIGFVHHVPSITKEKVKEVIDDYIVMNLFPRSLVQ